MTKLIAAAIIILALWGGWHLFLYWEDVKNEEQVARKEAIARTVTGSQLPGLPPQLESSLQAAQNQGRIAMRNWLRTHERNVQDPRRAWIELDYCVMIARDDPAEAKRIFAQVKERTPPSSPVWPRIKQLESSYQ